MTYPLHCHTQAQQIPWEAGHGFSDQPREYSLALDRHDFLTRPFGKQSVPPIGNVLQTPDASLELVPVGQPLLIDRNVYTDTPRSRPYECWYRCSYLSAEADRQI